MNASPTIFDIISFIVQVIIIGGVGLAWKIMSDKQTRRDQRLQQRWEQEQQKWEQEFGLLKAKQEERHKQWERRFSELKPTLEFEAKIAVEVANQHYRPVLEAVCAVDIYAEAFEVTEETIRAAKHLLETGDLPLDMSDMVKSYLENQEKGRLSEIILAMEQAQVSAAEILCHELVLLLEAIENFKKSGYMYELEAIVGRNYLKHFSNLLYAADIRALTRNCSPDRMSEFLADWNESELRPIRTLRDKVPWEKFLSHYLQKLMQALHA